MNYKRYKLVKTTFSKKEIEKLMSYCADMGYVLDQDPKEFNGDFIIIRNKEGNRKGYLQKIKGDIFWVYNNKRENISFYLDMYESISRFIDKLSNSSITKFLCGITDIEFNNNYSKK